MKIKLSKSQWEGIGRKAGWIRTAQNQADNCPDNVSNTAYRTIMSRLPEKWVKFLAASPETGMGQHHILITFVDGTKKDTYASNCQYVKDLMPEELGGKAIKDIQVSHR
jgi:hypothetical protein